MSATTDRAVVASYRLGAALARRWPEGITDETVRVLGGTFAAAMPGRRRMLSRHLQRVHGGTLSPPELRRAARRAFESYARYYLESFRLPDLGPAEIQAGIHTIGTDELWRTLDEDGRGAILALPHLGGWEWAAFWVTSCVRRPVAAVVEALQPPELFDWFVSFRRSLGMQVIALGPDAGAEVLAALKENRIVCLVADRDLAGTGIEVDFFGERTTLPSGPVLLGLRGGVKVFPAAVYFEEGGGHFGLVRPPMELDRSGRLREDVARHTQALATEFEHLIRRAPDQWHLFQPNWPSDERWLADRPSRQWMGPPG